MLGQKLMVKKWFASKSYSENENFILRVGEIPEVIRETEKAVQLIVVSDYGTIKIWAPKSCTQSYEEYKDAEKAEAEAENNRLQAGLEKYNKLVEWAEAQGIKCHRGKINFTKATIFKKIAEAGLTAPVF